MIEESEIRGELGDLPPEEREDLAALGGRLISSRPAPRAGFRAELRQKIRLAATGDPSPRPARLRVLIASYAGSGLLLLALASVGLAGLGPFAA